MISFHEPFSIKELTDKYKVSPAKALLAFNEKVEAGLRKEVIIIEDPENDWLAEHLLIMGRNTYILPLFQWRFDNDKRRIMEKTLCDKVNYLGKTSGENLNLLAQKVKTYFEALAKNRLRDENFARKLDYSFLRYIAIVAGFPVFISGYLSNLIPFIAPGVICRRFISDPRFYSSLYISSGTVIYLLYITVLLVLVGVFFGWTGFLLGLLTPLTGYFALFYQEIFRERFRNIRFLLISKQNPKLIAELTALRKVITCDLEKAEFNFPSEQH